jgi:hypothetical protein
LKATRTPTYKTEYKRVPFKKYVWKNKLVKQYFYKKVAKSVRKVKWATKSVPTWRWVTVYQNKRIARVSYVPKVSYKIVKRRVQKFKTVYQTRKVHYKKAADPHFLKKAQKFLRRYRF